MVEPDTRLKQAVDQKNAMTALLDSIGWKMLQGYIHSQIEQERNRILATRMAPIKIIKPDGTITETENNPMTQEFDKGVVHGKMHVLNLPSVLLEEGKVIAFKLQEDKADPSLDSTGTEIPDD